MWTSRVCEMLAVLPLNFAESNSFVWQIRVSTTYLIKFSKYHKIWISFGGNLWNKNHTNIRMILNSSTKLM